MLTKRCAHRQVADKGAAKLLQQETSVREKVRAASRWNLRPHSGDARQTLRTLANGAQRRSYDLRIATLYSRTFCFDNFSTFCHQFIYIFGIILQIGCKNAAHTAKSLTLGPAFHYRQKPLHNICALAGALQTLRELPNGAQGRQLERRVICKIKLCPLRRRCVKAPGA